MSKITLISKPWGLTGSGGAISEWKLEEWLSTVDDCVTYMIVTVLTTAVDRARNVT